MKIVQWDLFDIPEHEYYDSYTIMFNDHPTQYNLQVGDMIQQNFEDENYGTFCWIVTEVLEDVDRGIRGLTLVFAREV